MKFCIEIQNLEFEAIIGILDSEKKQAQKIVVNAKVFYTLGKDDKFKGVDSENFLDYAQIAEFIKRDISESKYELLESALQNLGAKLLANFEQIQKLNLQILKPQILKNCIVGVSAKFKK